MGEISEISSTTLGLNGKNSIFSPAMTHLLCPPHATTPDKTDPVVARSPGSNAVKPTGSIRESKARLSIRPKELDQEQKESTPLKSSWR